MTDDDLKQIRYRLGLDGDFTDLSPKTVTTRSGDYVTERDGDPVASSEMPCWLIDVDGRSFSDAVKLMFAMAAGTTSDIGESVETYNAADALVWRVRITIDSANNRTSVSYN